MELRNKLSFGAIRIDQLLEDYFDRDKILGYCKACPNYKKNWSCPPHQFDEKVFLKEFKYIHLIGRQYQVPKNDIRKIRDPKAISDYCTQKSEAMKVMTWKTLLEIENELTGVIGLIPGSCPICPAQGMTCSRESDQPCRFPNLMRYSLESLGFNVADLIKYEVGMMMKWPENQRLPDQLTAVAGILCNEEIPKEVLKKYFPDKKKSWVKYDETELDTQFKTSVLIKPSETIHGAKVTTKKTSIIDEEIPAYKPRKSWINYKGQVDEEFIKKPDPLRVTVQGEDQSVLEPEGHESNDYLDVFESGQKLAEKLAEKQEEIRSVQEIASDQDESSQVDENAEDENAEDEKKYKWLGFKAKVEDDDLPRRPIPKMSEVILEEDDQDSSPELRSDPQVVVEPQGALEEKQAKLADQASESQTDESQASEPIKIVKKTGPSLEKTISDLVHAASTEEENDDQNYKWLGFKGSLDEDD